MKKVLIAIFCFLSVFAFSQKPEQFIGSQNNRIIARGELRVDTLFFLPNRTDTTFSPGGQGALIRRSADKRLYYYNGDSWFTFTPPGEVGKYAVDSLEVLTDSTFRTRRNGLWTTYSMKGTGGTGLDTLYVNNKGASGVRISYTTGDSLNISKLINDDGSVTWSKNADSSANAKLNRTPGYLDIKNGGVASRTTSFKSYTDMRALVTANLDTSYVYYFQGKSGLVPYRYISSDATTADDSVSTIVTGGGARLRLSTQAGTVYASWFGAYVNDGIDDYAALQKAINYLVKNNVNGDRKLLLDPGNYNITQGLLIFKDDNLDGIPDGVNIQIEGAVASYAGGNNETSITMSGTQTFAIAIQRGKGSVIRNINLIGQNQITTTLPTLWRDTTSYLLSGIRNNSQSPYSGIVLDPFGAGTTGSNRYPGFESYYAAIVSNGGSTDCKFENITIDGFAVGVMMTPNVTTQNNEGHEFKNIWLRNLRNGFVTTNSQERTVSIKNVKAWTRVKYVFNTFDYGLQRGEVPTIDGVNIAGGIYSIFKFSGTGGYFPTINIQNVYAELFYKIGEVSGITVKFTGCHFAFGNPNDYGLKIQPYVYSGSLTEFDNCILIYYIGGIKVPMNIKGKAKFTNCYLNQLVGSPNNSWAEEPYEFEYENCRFYATGMGGVLSDQQSLNTGFNKSAFSGANEQYLKYGKSNVTYSYSFVYGATPVRAWQERRAISPLYKRYKMADGVSVTVSAGDSATATIAGLANRSELVGKIVWCSTTDSAGQVMRIKSIDGSGNIVFDKVVEEMVTGTYSLFVEDIQVYDVPKIADISGTSLTNVLNEGSVAAYTLPTGLYFVDNYPVYVTSSSAGAATIAGGYASGKRAILSSYMYEESGVSQGDPLTNAYFANGMLFTKGGFYKNVYVNNNADSNVIGYRVVKTGVKGSASPPEFQTVYRDAVPKLANDAAADAVNITYYYNTGSGTHKIKNGSTWYDISTGASTLYLKQNVGQGLDSSLNPIMLKATGALAVGVHHKFHAATLASDVSIVPRMMTSSEWGTNPAVGKWSERLIEFQTGQEGAPTARKNVIWDLGYNIDQAIANEGYLRIALESNYRPGGGVEWFEMHLGEMLFRDGTNFRAYSVTADKATRNATHTFVGNSFTFLDETSTKTYANFGGGTASIRTNQFKVNNNTTGATAFQLDHSGVDRTLTMTPGASGDNYISFTGGNGALYFGNGLTNQFNNAATSWYVDKKVKFQFSTPSTDQFWLTDGSQIVFKLSSNATTDGVDITNTKGDVLFGARAASSVFFRLMSEGYATSYFGVKPDGKIGLYATPSPAISLVTSATDAWGIPVGTNAQRPTGVAGYIRYISDSASTHPIEFHNGTSWFQVPKLTSGEWHFGASDQGNYRAQITGGLYEDGAVVLKGIATAPGTYNLLVKGLASDSSVYQLPLSSLTAAPKFTSVTSDPTDWTIGVSTFTTLADLTGVANHTITLPSAASNSGAELVIWNNSSDATFKWSYAAAITLADGTTRTTFADGTIDRLISNGTTWIKNN